MLASLPVFNHILDIILCSLELTHLYDLHCGDENLSFLACDRGRFLVMTVIEEEEEGLDREMIKLITASGDPNVSPTRFNPIGHAFSLDHRPTPEEVNLEAIKGPCNHYWRFLLDPEHPMARVTCEGIRLEILLSWWDKLTLCWTSGES